ncbi:MAG TPA: ice-binding family protein [Telluria sp.]|nr:ice-binding family protein [Telluria sp.]
MKLIAPALIALLASSSPAWAEPLLGPDLTTFGILGASTVTNVPGSAIDGNVGVWSPGGANAITGFASSPGVAVSDPQLSTGLVHAGTATAGAAQAQLAIARLNLDSLGPGTTLVSPDLSGLTLAPGVYTVHAGTTNLSGMSGALTLDGLGNANAVWVFQMDDTLITSPYSVVNLINAGPGAGLFWNVRSSATVGAGTDFQGNILALASISLNSGASIGCGSALAGTGAVTAIQNSIGIGCSGGLDVPTGGGIPAFLPFASVVPEPSSYAMLLAGLGILVMRRRAKAA